ncbi:MOSC domain-containing protein [Paenibacillus protaetiae]|uniref:MOSC domain-containing protein n=1 Tax=Paenibacillus protaetiae TaxID=2509456 RepID=A0A4P6EZ72_9BACL|nr:MOSC domain-containing protein [Paenibacillus protaetiae]QAY66007.1 MOSC domain-containing protein [Paenibacillus protaetiae]
MTSGRMETTIVSLQIGQPIAVKHGSKEVETAIFKQKSAAIHQLHVEGLDGDGQADRKHHGGPDKAVCAYFEKRFGYWERYLGHEVEAGLFGENFTLSEWTEDDVCIGDIWEGAAIALQVSQPRVPCFKLGIRNGNPLMPAEASNTGYTGFYFRVLKEGTVRAGDSLQLVHRPESAVTIAEANRIMHVDKNDRDGIRRLLGMEELAAAWREQLAARLDRLMNESLGGTQH